MVAQYSEGVQRTACLEVTPSDNITLTELHGDQNSLGDPRCFIATAAYGSAFAAELKIFRWFRSMLLQTGLGRSLVHTYYRYAPPAARWIARSEDRRSIARAFFMGPNHATTLIKEHL